jgi:electron transfer flavoprotein beta subunit
VVDYNVKIRVKSDGSGVEAANVKFSMNPFDETAVEEALRLRGAGKPPRWWRCRWGRRPARRLSARRWRWEPIAASTCRATKSCNLAVAKLLRAVVEHEKPGLVSLGKQAIDDDSNQTGQMLAALLGWPQRTFASNWPMHWSDQLVSPRTPDQRPAPAAVTPHRRHGKVQS